MFSPSAVPSASRAMPGELVMALAVGALIGPISLVFAGVIGTTGPRGGAIAMQVATLAFAITPVGQIVVGVTALSWLQQAGAYPRTALTQAIRPRLARCWTAWASGCWPAAPHLPPSLLLTCSAMTRPTAW